MLILIVLLLATLAPCPAAGRDWKQRDVLFLTSYNGGYQNRGYVASFLIQQMKRKKWQVDPINWDVTCGPSPSSIVLDEIRGIMYCIDEGLGAPTGSITAYNLTFVGGELPASRVKLTGHFRPPGNRVKTLPGSVSATLYGFDKKNKKGIGHDSKGPTAEWEGGVQFLCDFPSGQQPEWLRGQDNPTHQKYYLAVAHYAGSALSGWVAPERGRLEGVSSWGPDAVENSYKYRLDGPGPNPERQDAAHPHQSLLDPTEDFLLVPDLGADKVRIYQTRRIGRGEGSLVSQPPLLLPAGCGPRHGAFVRHKVKVPKKERKKNMVHQEWRTYFHLVCELSNLVTSYKVEYPKRLDMAESIEFKPIGVQNTFGGARIPEGAAAAEIAVSPDGKFVIVSNRNDSSFPDFSTPGPSFPNEPQTTVESDSLATFSIAGDGTLKFEELSPAGGSFPRSFAFNKKGNAVAVALQYSGSLAVFSRNIKTGRMGKQEARYNDLGNVTSVTFAKKRMVDPQTKVPGGDNDVKSCLIMIDQADPGACYTRIFIYLPETFEWLPQDEWRNLQMYPAPGTNVISRFPFVVHPDRGENPSWHPMQSNPFRDPEVWPNNAMKNWSKTETDYGSW